MAATRARLPSNLGEALQALRDDGAMVDAMGAGFVRYYTTIKNQELARHAQAQDAQEWERREYFGRI